MKTSIAIYRLYPFLSNNSSKVDEIRRHGKVTCEVDGKRVLQLFEMACCAFKKPPKRLSSLKLKFRSQFHLIRCAKTVVFVVLHVACCAMAKQKQLPDSEKGTEQKEEMVSLERITV